MWLCLCSTAKRYLRIQIICPATRLINPMAAKWTYHHLIESGFSVEISNDCSSFYTSSIQTSFLHVCVSGRGLSLSLSLSLCVCLSLSHYLVAAHVRYKWSSPGHHDTLPAHLGTISQSARSLQMPDLLLSHCHLVLTSMFFPPSSLHTADADFHRYSFG